MKLKVVCLLFLCTCFLIPSFSQKIDSVTGKIDSVAHRVILIGDAGELERGTHPALKVISKAFNLNDKKNTVLFLGDNIYPLGLPSTYASNYEDKRKVLDDQVKLVQGTQAQAYFIPGNHDWMRGRSGGWQQILNQSRYINSLQLPNVQFLPQGGCPGPEEISLADNMVLVIIDSQWWLQRYAKPGVRSGCEAQSEAEFLSLIRDVVDRNRNKLMIFAAHHPFITYGRHGGYYGIKQHIFPFTEMNRKLWIPLPIIGSIYPIARGVFGDIQDLRHPIYKNFSSAVDSILKEHPYCIRVAGHEHNMQMIQLENQFYIVSGAGSKQSEIIKGPGTKYADNGPGFSMIETMLNGQVRVSFFPGLKDTTGKPAFVMSLPSLDTTPVKAKPYKINPFPEYDSFPGYKYYKAGKFKKWLLGKNYRDEWTQSVRVKVFDIGKEHGGLTATRKGGGLQTKSLRLIDTAGNEYVLRSVEKFPDNTLPEEFRQTFVKDAVVDGISASYPYAALSIPPLLDVLGIPHASPKLVFVPDDPRFGYYQADFKNTLAIYEEREPGGYDKTYSTEKVLEKLQEDNDDKVDQAEVLKARLFDMFIMDFDRHEDQWRWGTRDTGKGKIYFPIPRDRDQAFFVNMGLVPSFIRKPYLFPKFQGFRAKAININTFNFNARYFDRSFLNRMSDTAWKNHTDTLLQLMTDPLLEKALQMQPQEIRKYSASLIVHKLKERKKYLPQEAMQYYRFLAKEVDVPGSDKNELFHAHRNKDGSVRLTVTKIDKNGKPAGTFYDRTFRRNETKEIRLYGLAGEDHFLITGASGRKTIKVRMIGGRDDDVFENNSDAPRGKAIVYDLSLQKNTLTGTGSFRNRLSSDMDINEFNRNAFKYNELIPGLGVGFNIDDGVFLGARLRRITHGFRKEPFKVKQDLVATHAVATKSYNFRYYLEAIDVIKKADLLIDARLRAPKSVANFFRIGNETDFDEDQGKFIEFYRTRYDYGELAVLLRSKLTQEVSLSYGPLFSYFSMDRRDNIGRLINYPYLNGLDSATLYKDKSYIGPLFSINVDNRNDDVIPTRGVIWNTTVRFNQGLGDYSKNTTQLTTDLSVFISSNSPARLVFALRFGGGINWGNYEFFQAQYLGGTENLRGYRKFRFAGDKMLYNNIEARYRLIEFQTYLFPGALGLLVFHDLGRVWVKTEDSHVWHTGYGAGLWLAPAKRAVFTASYTASKEGALPLLTFGFQF